jgi:ribosomal protein S18 acetylase RimI-like enzyme
MTLLVSESNVAARRLYERLGFTPRASFVAARR